MKGNLPRMVDVSGKVSGLRVAVAEAIVSLPKELQNALVFNQESNQVDIAGPKGPIVATAVIAGTMAVKNTSTLIPFCHPLPISGCDIQISSPAPDHLRILCTVKIIGNTGVEMEALTGATVASLCIYDMCKAVSKDIVISNVQLVHKSGGKSGDYNRTQEGSIV